MVDANDSLNASLVGSKGGLTCKEVTRWIGASGDWRKQSLAMVIDRSAEVHRGEKNATVLLHICSLF